MTEVASRRGIDRSLIYRWRREKVSRRGAIELLCPFNWPMRNRQLLQCTTIGRDQLGGDISPGSRMGDRSGWLLAELSVADVDGEALRQVGSMAFGRNCDQSTTVRQ